MYKVKIRKEYRHDCELIIKLIQAYNIEWAENSKEELTLSFEFLRNYIKFKDNCKLLHIPLGIVEITPIALNTLLLNYDSSLYDLTSETKLKLCIACKQASISLDAFETLLSAYENEDSFAQYAKGLVDMLLAMTGVLDIKEFIANIFFTTTSDSLEALSEIREPLYDKFIED